MNFPIFQITDRDAWPLDSDFSNLALVDRADRISIPGVIEFFHRYHMVNCTLFFKILKFSKKISKNTPTKLKLAS